MFKWCYIGQNMPIEAKFVVFFFKHFLLYLYTYNRLAHCLFVEGIVADQDISGFQSSLQAVWQQLNPGTVAISLFLNFSSADAQTKLRIPVTPQNKPLGSVLVINRKNVDRQTMIIV